jgi:hypothetical protein
VWGHKYKGLSKGMCHKHQKSSQMPWNCHCSCRGYWELLVYWEVKEFHLGCLACTVSPEENKQWIFFFFFFFHNRTMHLDIIKVLLIHQLMHKWVVLKNNIKIYIKTAPTCFGAVTPPSGSALIRILCILMDYYNFSKHELMHSLMMV